MASSPIHNFENFDPAPLRFSPRHFAVYSLVRHAELVGKGQNGGLAMLLDNLRTQRAAIEALGQQFGARHIRVFGSVARGEERPDSDVDFLVEFPRGYDLFSQRLPFAERLARLIGRKVEVIPEHELNRHIRDHVLKEAVEL